MTDVHVIVEEEDAQTVSEMAALVDAIQEVCDDKPLYHVLGALTATLVCVISLSTDNVKDFRKLTELTMTKIQLGAVMEALRRAPPAGNA
jgi:hypothetical protein